MSPKRKPPREVQETLWARAEELVESLDACGCSDMQHDDDGCPPLTIIYKALCWAWELPAPAPVKKRGRKPLRRGKK